MTTIQQYQTDVKTIQFSDDTYAVVDPRAGAISLHKGQRTGADDDWGGQVVAWLELDKALAIFEAVQALGQGDGAEMRTRFWGGGPAAHDDDAWIDEMARRHEERLDAIADATSAHFGHD